MSLNENSTGVKFSELERMVYDMALELGRRVLTETLEAMSQGLHMQLDSSRYENKGIPETHINTLFGTVAYRRHVYYDRDTRDEGGKCKCVYPLDERLGMTVFQAYTEAVVETVVGQCTHVSFRKAAKAVSDMTGLSISHGTAWNMVQRFGHGLDEYDKQLVEKDRQNVGWQEGRACCFRRSGWRLSAHPTAQPKEEGEGAQGSQAGSDLRRMEEAG